jgi:hypothetical protein
MADSPSIWSLIEVFSISYKLLGGGIFGWRRENTGFWGEGSFWNNADGFVSGYVDICI